MSTLRADGGVCANILLMQMQADLMGLPVLRPQTTKTTALDAALLAGFQAGVLSEPAQLKKRLAIERVFEPHRSRDETQAHLQAWDLAVEGSR